MRRARKKPADLRRQADLKERWAARQTIGIIEHDRQLDFNRWEWSTVDLADLQVGSPY